VKICIFDDTSITTSRYPWIPNSHCGFGSQPTKEEKIAFVDRQLRVQQGGGQIDDSESASLREAP
jgi:hypothetical protein